MTGSNPSVSVHAWISSSDLYDDQKIEANASAQITMLLEDVWYSHTFVFDNLTLGKKSVKVDYYEHPEFWDAGDFDIEIEEIKIYSERRHPLFAPETEERKGFWMSGHIQGQGGDYFKMDGNISGYFIDTPGHVSVDARRTEVTRPCVSCDWKRWEQAVGNVPFGVYELLEFMRQATYGSQNKKGTLRHLPFDSLGSELVRRQLPADSLKQRESQPTHLPVSSTGGFIQNSHLSLSFSELLDIIRNTPIDSRKTLDEIIRHIVLNSSGWLNQSSLISFDSKSSQELRRTLPFTSIGYYYRYTYLPLSSKGLTRTLRHISIGSIKEFIATSELAVSPMGGHILSRNIPIGSDGWYYNWFKMSFDYWRDVERRSEIPFNSITEFPQMLFASPFAIMREREMNPYIYLSSQGWLYQSSNLPFSGISPIDFERQTEFASQLEYKLYPNLVFGSDLEWDVLRNIAIGGIHGTHRQYANMPFSFDQQRSAISHLSLTLLSGVPRYVNIPFFALASPYVRRYLPIGFLRYFDNSRNLTVSAVGAYGTDRLLPFGSTGFYRGTRHLPLGADQGIYSIIQASFNSAGWLWRLTHTSFSIDPSRSMFLYLPISSQIETGTSRIISLDSLETVYNLQHIHWCTKGLLLSALSNLPLSGKGTIHPLFHFGMDYMFEFGQNTGVSWDSIGILLKSAQVSWSTGGVLAMTGILPFDLQVISKHFREIPVNSDLTSYSIRHIPYNLGSEIPTIFISQLPFDWQTQKVGHIHLPISAGIKESLHRGIPINSKGRMEVSQHLIFDFASEFETWMNLPVDIRRAFVSLKNACVSVAQTLDIQAHLRIGWGGKFSIRWAHIEFSIDRDLPVFAMNLPVAAMKEIYRINSMPWDLYGLVLLGIQMKLLLSSTPGMEHIADSMPTIEQITASMCREELLNMLTISIKQLKFTIAAMKLRGLDEQEK